MAKTLVITGANYSDNKLDTVTWGESTPCTAIELNKSTTEIKCGNTETLVATPTPSNTTDSISWASSDETVATVNGGVVTVVGLGTATITVTCGTQSDTCEVTATADVDTDNVVKLVGTTISKVPLATGSNGYSSISSSAYRGTISSSTGLHQIQKTTISDVMPYPYKLPNNTTHIKITLASGITVNRMAWYNDANTKDWDNVTVCPQIGMTENPSAVGGVVTVAVPSFDTYPEINAFIVALYSENEFKQADFDGTTVEFLHIDG